MSQQYTLLSTKESSGIERLKEDQTQRFFHPTFKSLTKFLHMVQKTKNELENFQSWLCFLNLILQYFPIPYYWKIKFSSWLNEWHIQIFKILTFPDILRKNMLFSQNHLLDCTSLFTIIDRITNLVFRSWSRNFFSISASVNVSKYGHHLSISIPVRRATSTVGNGCSLNAYVFLFQFSWPRILKLSKVRQFQNSMQVQVQFPL